MKSFAAWGGRNFSFSEPALMIRVSTWAVKDEEGRKAQGEEAGAGEVSKVCEYNRPLEAPPP